MPVGYCSHLVVLCRLATAHISLCMTFRHRHPLGA